MFGGPALRALLGFSLHWALWTLLVRPLPALTPAPSAFTVDSFAAMSLAI
jgi:hypothetical protein